MSVLLGWGCRRLGREYGLLLLSAVLLASGCAPVHGSAPALSFSRSITAG
jgi:hypothetical protein